MTQFEDLNDDILFLVLQYVCPSFQSRNVGADKEQLEIEHFSTLQHFRLVSWRLKDFAESQLYKDVTVGDDEDNIDATNRFIERLTNQRDTLSRHVQNFTVASFEGDDDSSCLNVQLFVKLMAAFQQLSSFRSVFCALFQCLHLCITSAGMSIHPCLKRFSMLSTNTGRTPVFASRRRLSIQSCSRLLNSIAWTSPSLARIASHLKHSRCSGD